MGQDRVSCYLQGRPHSPALRNKDIFEWLFSMGLYDVKRDDITDPQVLKMKPPQVSGVGLRGLYHQLAISGAERCGYFRYSSRCRCQVLFFLLPNAPEHVQFADAFSQRIKTQIEEYIAANNLAASPQKKTRTIYRMQEPPALQVLQHLTCWTITSLPLSGQPVLQAISIIFNCLFLMRMVVRSTIMAVPIWKGYILWGCRGCAGVSRAYLGRNRRCCFYLRAYLAF